MPGPGYYDAEYTAIKRRSPMYSMGGKHKMPSDDIMKPGPGAHCPEKVCLIIAWKFLRNNFYNVRTFQVNLSNVPSYSFGIKHSPYLGYLRDHRDFGFSGIC